LEAIVNICRSGAFYGVVVVAVIGGLGANASVRAADALPQVAKPQSNAAVSVTDAGANFVLDNGIVQATINKRNGDM
jgi:hypothetical protein